MGYNGQRMREINYRKGRSVESASGMAVLDNDREQRIGRRCTEVILSLGLLASGILTYLVLSGRLLSIWTRLP